MRQAQHGEDLQERDQAPMQAQNAEDLQAKRDQAPMHAQNVEDLKGDRDQAPMHAQKAKDLKADSDKGPVKKRAGKVEWSTEAGILFIQLSSL